MKIFFIISAQLLVLISCGKDSGSSDEVIGDRAPRYRALLRDSQESTKGTAIFREEEEEEEMRTEVHVVSSSLRGKIRRSLVVEGPCPRTKDEISEESIRFDLGREKGSSISTGPTPPFLGGHSLVLESEADLLACGPLVPIPLE